MADRKISVWLLAYGFVFAFFHIMPAFLTRYIKRSLTWGDALDFLSPLAFISVSYLLYSLIKESLRSSQKYSGIQKKAGKVILFLGFLLYVDGHGLHLSANSIARLLENMKDTELFKATYLFDEIISHFMWDGGVFSISLGLIILASKLSLKHSSQKNIAFIHLGAVFYGFTFTVNGIEGQTVVITFPAACLGFILTLVLYLKARKKGLFNPYHLFFCSAYFLSLILFAYWGISHSGFPQFSELGWI